MEDRLVVRYRKNKDDDLKYAMENLPPYLDRADVVRAALRAFIPRVLDGSVVNIFDQQAPMITKIQMHKPVVNGLENETDSDKENEEIELQEIEISDDDIEANLDDVIGQF